MTTVDDHARAIELMLAPRLAAPVVETVTLADARGRVTATAIASAVDLPLFRNSQMDGFAVRAADLTAVPVTLPISDEVPAGRQAEHPLRPGTAARIMTGAPVPDGADAIVPVEDTRSAPGSQITIDRARSAGDFVRERGSDLRVGDTLIPAGVRLAPRHLAAVAAAGLGEVPVLRRLRVAVITTGAELVAGSDSPLPGQIYDANRIALTAAVVEAGADVVFSAVSDDDPAAFRRIFDAAVAVSELVITSGGISMGDYEVVRESLVPRGATVAHLALQPGGPQAIALIDDTPVVCFPGNPVSTQVSFILFLRPLLLRAAGRPQIPMLNRQLARPIRSVPGKRQFLRGTLLGDDQVDQVAGASSHLVAAMARSDVLIDVPAEVDALDAGATVTVWTL